MDQPLPSPTSHGAGALVQPYLVSVAHGDGCDENAAKRRSFSIESPLPTITAGGGEFSVIEPSIAPLVVQTDQTGSNGTCVRSATEDPLLTPVTKQNHAIVTTSIASALDCNALKSAIEQGRVVVIDGIPYVIDILFRMLEPYELARGMGFSDEESQYEFVGNKGQVVKQIGNAVSVRTACALVGALFHDQLGQNRKDVQPAMPHAA